MTEDPASYNDEPPAERFCLVLPGRLAGQVRELAMKHAGGAVESMLRWLLMRELDPTEASKIEAALEARR